MLSIMDARYFAELAFLFKNKEQEIIRIQEIESLVNTCMYANCFFPIWLETGLATGGNDALDNRPFGSKGHHDSPI